MRNKILNFNHFMVYLAGAIQYTNDGGVGWRDMVTSKMTEIGISEKNIINPCDKPLTSFNNDDLDANMDVIDKLKKDGKWSDIEKMSKSTIRIDLRSVDKSDLIYCHLDPAINTVGTIDEISVARTQRKPVIVVTPGGIANASYWIIGRVGRKHIFPDDDSAISYIRDILKGRRSFDTKSWLFFDFGDR